jgi:2-hydroxy-6-oxonona-2,4-dienedioate hydrolase
MRTKFIDVDGINTRYLYEGEGNETALLLIHGGGVAADTWLRNIDELGKEFAVYAPDNIGHGFTDAIDLGADLPQPHTTRHLIRFMETIGVNQYSVGGSSYGALIAGLVYFDAPDRVDKLIFVGSSSVFDTDENYRKALQGAYDNAAKTIGNPDLADCRRRLNNAVHDPASVPDEVLIMQLTQYAQPDRVEFYVAANRNRVDAKGPIGSRIIDKLEEIKVPTLVITGKQDKRTNWGNTELTAKRIPDARCVTIDQCGHLPYIEHPKAFNDLVADFLRS